MQYQQIGLGVCTVDNVLSRDACDRLLRQTEAIGYQPAPIASPSGFRMAPEVRNNTRVMLEDRALTSWLWKRLRPLVPNAAGRGGGIAVGLNERLRYYRYEAGQYFQWHHDGAFERNSHERSTMTLMVYLNDDCQGGHTEFRHCPAVEPRRGTALLFEHEWLHRGATVTAGVKYVLRTDVMVRWKPQARAVAPTLKT